MQLKTSIMLSITALFGPYTPGVTAWTTLRRTKRILSFVSSSSAYYSSTSVLLSMSDPKHDQANEKSFRNHLIKSSESGNHHQNDVTSNNYRQLLRHRYFALRHGQSLANVAGIIASDPNVACNKYGLSPTGKQQAQRAGQDLVNQIISTTKPSSVSSSSSETQGPLVVGVAILSSDLLRARETAEIVANEVRNANKNTAGASIRLYNDNVVIDTRLRERYFGTWDGMDDKHYNDVWVDDAINPFHEHNGVESVWSVVDRSTQCIYDWDEKLTSEAERQQRLQETNNDDNILPEQWWVICVAHGDVLQILQTAFTAINNSSEASADEKSVDPSQHRSLEHLETATLRRLN